MIYYNEFDPFAAAWLRGLIAGGILPAGVVCGGSPGAVRAEVQVARNKNAVGPATFAGPKPIQWREFI